MNIHITAEFEQQVKDAYKNMFRVRERTPEEDHELEQFGDNPTGRIAKLIRSSQIDYQRYEEAKASNPHVTEHMERMQNASLSFVRQMTEIYQVDHGITFDETGIVDDASLPEKGVPTILDAEYIGRPA